MRHRLPRTAAKLAAALVAMTAAIAGLAPAATAAPVSLPLQTATGMNVSFPVSVTYLAADGSPVSVPVRLNYGKAEFDVPAGATVTATTDRVGGPRPGAMCPPGFTPRTTSVTFTAGEPPPLLVAPPIAPVLTNPAVDEYEQRAFDELNRIRVEAGVPPVAMVDRLNLAADIIATAKDIGDGCRGHWGVNGDEPFDRLVEVGASTRSGVGEIAASLCYCESSPEEDTRGFLNSPPHRSVMISPRNIHGGVARVGKNLIFELVGADFEIFADAPIIPLRADRHRQPANETPAPAKPKPTITHASVRHVRNGVIVTGQIAPALLGQKVRIRLTRPRTRRIVAEAYTTRNGRFKTRQHFPGTGKVTARITTSGAVRTVHSH